MVPCDARHHPNRTHDLRSGSQDHHPSTNSVQKTICCNSTSNAPDDGRMRPEHVELRIHHYLVASSRHFTLFHDEDARSNNPQIRLHQPFLYTGITECYDIQLIEQHVSTTVLFILYKVRLHVSTIHMVILMSLISFKS